MGTPGDKVTGRLHQCKNDVKEFDGQYRGLLFCVFVGGGVRRCCVCCGWSGLRFIPYSGR